ncbi:cell wall hydrolase [Sphingorhabdus arenilitoris]|uniref:Cell wall hydrolase n=1 Tax=Sphingorhabdus arenilitoris TaxID=1490041 RepID=A0ABV8REK1_9SPHN
MLKFSKAATFAATFVALASVTIYSDPGLAFGSAEADTALTASVITVDPAVLAADVSAAAMASKPDVEMTVKGNGDIIFIPGIADTEPMKVPEKEIIPEEDSRAYQPISASSLRELVRAQNTDIALTEEERCLAGTIFFESKGESLAGQLAVAKVVLARKNSGRFPSSICGVVYQKSQFSFIRGGRMPKINTSKQSWRNAVAIAQIALNDAWDSPVEGALFFHAKRVRPGWRLTRLGSIDNHIFYR